MTFLEAEARADRPGAKDRLDAAKKKHADLLELADALGVVSDQSLAAAEPLAAELVRLASDRPEGFRDQAAIAFFRGQWGQYDRALATLARVEPTPGPETKFLRGAEAVVRGVRPDRRCLGARGSGRGDR